MIYMYSHRGDTKSTIHKFPQGNKD